MEITNILDYLFKDWELKKYVITTSTDRNDASAHLQLLIKTNVQAPEDGLPQMIVLDNKVSTSAVKTYLWDLINPEQKQIMTLYYRRKV